MDSARERSSLRMPKGKSSTRKTRHTREDCADICATGQNGTRRNSHEDEIAGVGWLSGEARSLHPRLHPDAEEAELRIAQGCARSPDEFGRSHDLHSGNRSQ